MTKIHLPIKNRETAGIALASALARYTDLDNTIVLALPRGGVPVAYEVADRIGAKLDLIIVRKLGTPGHRELAMGAIASGGIRVLNKDIIARLRIPEGAINAVTLQEQRELERREVAYRGSRPLPVIKDQRVILVDDGIATGATMRAGIQALKQQQPAEIIVAVPVAPPDTIEMLKKEANKIVCLGMPEPFYAIGNWYQAFPQIEDEEVKQLLQLAWNKIDQSLPA